jgi:uncharacterized protein
MSTQNGSGRFEYPDNAGYPDGAGFLDEGTAALVDEVLADAVRDSVDQPSADAESEIRVHHNDHKRVYAATLGELELANLRYDEVDGRVVILTTTVAPEFRGRGITTELIAYALDDIRDRGMSITVYCRVVAAFISGNQQYADLLDTEHPGL